MQTHLLRATRWSMGSAPSSSLKRLSFKSISCGLNLNPLKKIPVNTSELSIMYFVYTALVGTLLYDILLYEYNVMILCYCMELINHFNVKFFQNIQNLYKVLFLRD